MKRLKGSFTRSKASLLFLLVATGIVISVTSCSKKEEETTPGVTNENAVVVINQAITAKGGVTEQIASAASIVAGLEARQAAGGKLADFCGLSNKDSVKLSGETDGFAFAYGLFWNYKLVCLDKEPQQFNFDYNGRTTLATKEFNTDDSTSSHYTLKGFTANNTTWEVTQNFDRSGKLVSRIDKIPTFTSTIHYESSNIKIDKRTKEIVSGTAAIRITGSDTKRNAFRFEGTLTFKGDRKATYVTSGGNFDLQW